MFTYIPYAETDDISFDEKHILVVVEPKQDLLKSYNQSVSKTNSENRTSINNIMSGIEYKETLTIHFIKKDGQVQDVRVPIGMTLMDVNRIMQNFLLLMKWSDCGGNQSCGTCHINIKEDIDKVGIVDYNSLENEILEQQPEYDRMYSRLGCQVVLRKQHNGLKVYLRDYNNV